MVPSVFFGLFLRVSTCRFPSRTTNSAYASLTRYYLSRVTALGHRDGGSLRVALWLCSWAPVPTSQAEQSEEEQQQGLSAEKLMRRVSKDVRRLREQSQNVPREVQSFRWGSGGMMRMLFVEEGRLQSPETCVGGPVGQTRARGPDRTSGVDGWFCGLR